MFLPIFEKCPNCLGDKRTVQGENCQKCNGLGRIKSDLSVYIGAREIQLLQGKIEKSG
jgi:DnaJ-class molecular chaperone